MRLFFFLLLLFPTAYGCQKVVDKDDIQREESYNEDEMHEDDSFDQSVPANTEDGIEKN